MISLSRNEISSFLTLDYAYPLSQLLTHTVSTKHLNLKAS
jgi:hypothetical protein